MAYQRKLAGFEDDVNPHAAGSVAVAGAAPSGALAGQTVYAIDAHSLIYQVFHALPDMTSPAGQAVGAVHGFIRDVLDILEKKRPNYLICAFDHPGDTFRHELYDRYKIDREAMPDDLRPQIASIRRLLDALGVLSLDLAGFEADDILATLADQVDRQGGTCFVVTGDKDCRQLISPNVFVYNIRKDLTYDAAALQQDWGVRPDQVVDFQSLVGDSVDNVPGVPGIGPKTARELLEKYDTLESVLEHAEEITAKKRRENLINGRDQALLSRKLVRLARDVPLDFSWDVARVGGVDDQQVQQLCREFGFRGLGQRLAELTVKDAPTSWVSTYRTLASPEDLDWLVGELSKQDIISIDTETTSTVARQAELVGYSFAWREGEAFYVPVRAPKGDPCLDPEATLAALKPILENAAIKKVGQNLKYDMVVLRSAGVRLAGLWFDTMVAHYLLEPGQRNHGLDELAERYLNHTKIKISSLIGSGKQQKRMDEVPVEFVSQYACEDADVPLRLYSILQRRLQDEGLEKLFVDLEMPLVEVLAELEFNGIRVNVDLLRELSGRFGERIDRLENEIYILAGHRFNIDSRQQLGHVLFDELQLPVIKKTKTGPSTDADVLTQLMKLGDSKLPAKVIEYRQDSKLKSTYIDALSEIVHPDTGRVHSSFMQDVAATGRLSSKDPNLQNIPVRTEEGREIRSAFVPQAGWKLVAADYSQIELRVLAHFSGDESLRAAFAEDQDIHARVAGQVYAVPLDGVTSQMRRSAKAINFGIIYGQSAFGLAKALDIEKDEAAEFIEAYFAGYPGVDNFMSKVLEDCRRNRYVETISGRRRTIQGVRDPGGRGDSRQRNLPERIAINTVIQGSAADLIKQAMIDVFHCLRKQTFRARMLLQIHDELVFETPPEELEPLITLVRETMTSVYPLNVPLKVDVKTGDNWADCEPWI